MLRKFLPAVIQALFLIAWCHLAVAQSNIIGGGVFGDTKKTAATFQGPGDVVSGATAWGSCARVYDAALASTSTSLCDLVDSAAPTVVICTLRGTASGFVDLAGTYCTGSVTPATKCAAATGGTCNISKVYDQIGATGGWAQVTAASQPKLAFSAVGGLPGMQFAAGSMVLATSGTFTQGLPYSVSTVVERTNTSSAGVLEASNSQNGVDFAASATTAQCPGPSAAASPDSAFHSIQCVQNTGTLNSSAVVDGAVTGPSTSANTMANPLRFGRNNGGSSLTGIIMEGGVWPSLFTPTQYANMNTNQHSSANGYNF